MMMSTMGVIHHILSIRLKKLKNNKIIKQLFQLVFSTYLPIFLLKFTSGSTHWMQKLIPHPRSTHVKNF